MNLLIRLAFLVIARFTFRRRHCGIHDTIETPFRVWVTDHDVFGHMTYSRYLSHFGLSILDFHIQTGLWKAATQKGWFPVVARSETSFLRSLKFPKTFVIKTRAAGWSENYVAVEHQVERNGRVVAEGYTFGRYVDGKGNRISTTEVLTHCGLDPVSPAMPDALRERLEAFEKGSNSPSTPSGT